MELCYFDTKLSLEEYFTFNSNIDADELKNNY